MARRRRPHAISGQRSVVVRDGRGAQPGVPAERLNRGVFGSQTRRTALPIERRDPVQPPAQRAPRWAEASSRPYKMNSPIVLYLHQSQQHPSITGAII
jgi:hypothetical protein